MVDLLQIFVFHLDIGLCSCLVGGGVVVAGSGWGGGGLGQIRTFSWQAVLVV